MIVFDLKCADCEQKFEGWFSSHDDFMQQKQDALLTCPLCESGNIKKQLSTPAISKKANQSENIGKNPALSPENMRKLIKDFRQHVVSNFEDVGDKFAEESRKMHYGEADERGIYGKASLKEVQDLHDEGIETLPIPELPKDN
ncbi:MAG: DUF1178 family protein [Alphaproteobacteria bacterium]